MTNHGIMWNPLFPSFLKLETLSNRRDKKIIDNILYRYSYSDKLSYRFLRQYHNKNPCQEIIDDLAISLLSAGRTGVHLPGTLANILVSQIKSLCQDLYRQSQKMSSWGMPDGFCASIREPSIGNQAHESHTWIAGIDSPSCFVRRVERY